MVGSESAEIRFYHLQRMPLEKALTMILRRVVERDQRAVVVGSDVAKLEMLDTHLWTSPPEAFIAHGRAGDPAMAGFEEHQAVWLDEQPSTPNKPQVLLQIDGAESDLGTVSGIEICCDLFDGNDDAAVAAARDRWKRYRDGGYRLTYWQETEQGGWAEKASHPPKDAAG
ncbi:MAG: DNA polymerase III subunit chi [Alphaproteobacteria bacterium]|nr:DNA polymerase III subunit chi [Alphaproteobacteria bacterium SS10]